MIETVRETDEVFAIGHRNKPEVLLMKVPNEYNAALSDITYVNTYSESFSFLENEPDLYTEKEERLSL
ncbi:MAG: hypothetical protein AUK16_01260 [Parcubacteria group bacterium CG2_30_44_11]|nr:MAG: hypothetical protein AUK16_01260 [Parcubacteria group bacterium CG2_30_44_11]